VAVNTRPRFLCDEMLGRLGRYLRAAGYDALQANGGHHDREWLRQCREEGRYFLTQDRLVSEHKAARGVALILPQGDLDRLAGWLGEELRLDWLDQSFTRCIVDNTPLLPADEEALKHVPPDAVRPNEPLTVCPACGRVYWPGSHYKRMRSRLAQWQAARENHSS
jgi:uncharacterized protein with PIN domain